MKPFISLITVVLLNIMSCKDNPVNLGKPENRRPVIFSLTVFPSIIGTTDSAIVICNAMDPDGDTLVYDWYTDGRLNLKGVPSYAHEESNTRENYQIFYPTQYISFPVDTPWVQVYARDRKGGMSYGETVHFIVRQ